MAFLLGVTKDIVINTKHCFSFCGVCKRDAQKYIYIYFKFFPIMTSLPMTYISQLFKNTIFIQIYIYTCIYY